MDRELGDTIPTFNRPAEAADRRVDITNLSALTSALGGIRTWNAGPALCPISGSLRYIFSSTTRSRYL